MFDLGQKLVVESFQLELMVVYLTELSFLSKNSVIFRQYLS